MTTENEQTPGNGRTEIEALKQEVQSQSAAQIRQEILDMASKAAEVRQIIELNLQAGKTPDKFEGTVNDKDSAKGKAADLKTVVVKALLAVKEPGKIPSPEGKPQSVTDLAVNILRKVGEHIKPSDVTEQSAPYLYQIINKVINGEITSVDSLASEFNKLQFLKIVNPYLYDNLQKSFVELAKTQGVVEEEAKKKFRVEEKHDIMDRAGKDSFEQEWIRNSYGDYLNDEEDKQVVRAIYSVEGLADLAKQIKEEQNQSPEFNSLSEKDKNRIISEEIEAKIVLVFSKIYKRIDDEKQSQFVEEIIQEGLFNSIQVIHHRLKQRLIYLKNDIAGQNQNDLPEILKQLKFYKRQTDYTVSEREIELEGGDKKIKPISRPRPSLNTEQISLTEFLDVVLTESNHEIESRKFFHNIGALLVRSADPEKGFWPQIASYADQMDATDIDEIMHLPDNNIAQAAFSLYTKYLSEAFAKFNWIHQPAMFSPEAQGIRSQIQKSVLQSLEEMFPEKLGKDGWRLKRAMSFGLGLARAVFITEEEQAAWADPNIEQDSGGATYRSYYTNDNTALNALNPMHTFLRWQSEQAIKGPILFSLISGFDSKLTNMWDHNELWKRMQEYKESFGKGMSAFETKKPGERLFIELLANVGRVGSIITRDGWRTQAAYEGWLDYEKVKDDNNKETSVETKQLKYLNSFNNLEYIGFEVLLDFINNKFSNGEDGYNKFLAASSNIQVEKPRLEKEYKEEKSKLLSEKRREKDKSKIEEIDKKIKNIEDKIRNLGKSQNEQREKLILEREAFFTYLFNKYIKKEDSNETLGDYLEGFKKSDDKDIERNIDRLIKEGRIRYGIREQAIEAETYRRIMYRALAGVFAQRVPTKFAILERDRTSDNGIRAWERIRAWEEIEGKIRKKDKPFTYEEMESLMQNLMFVETELRGEISKKMIAYLQGGHKNFYEGFSPDYKVDEEVIRRILNEKIDKRTDLTSEQKEEEKKKIEKVIEIFKSLREEFIDDDDFLSKFSEKLRGKDAAENLKDKNFPFAIATEELDSSFLAYKNAGQKVLKRAHGDTGGAEQVVFKSIEGLLKMLNTTAVNPEHKIDDLIKHIGAAHAQTEAAIGKDDANKLAYQLASMTIAYFKKDTLARNIFTKWFRFGKKNSLAAEFTGAYRGAWEWDVSDIDRFIVELERQRILPKEPYDLSKKARYNWEPAKLFGITIGNKKVRLPDYQFYGNKLRREHGASKGHITGEILNKYLPIFLLFLLYKFISDALKKAEGKE